MKQSRQWVTDPETKFIACQTFEIQAVQLDAWKQGMRDAAAIAEKEGYKKVPKDVKNTILNAAELRDTLYEKLPS